MVTAALYNHFSQCDGQQRNTCTKLAADRAPGISNSGWKMAKLAWKKIKPNYLKKKKRTKKNQCRANPVEG